MLIQLVHEWPHDLQISSIIRLSKTPHKRLDIPSEDMVYFLFQTSTLNEWVLNSKSYDIPYGSKFS